MVLNMGHPWIGLGSDAEVRHFDALVARTGESWWGHQTAAGQARLARRARIVAQQLPLGPAYHVLEVAAGTGALTDAVLREAPSARITATDISPVSVLRLEQRVRAHRYLTSAVADMTHLDYADATFDGVMANSALHHVDVRVCLQELFRVLRPGGRLVAFEPNLLNPEVFIEMTVARRMAMRNLEYSATERTHSRWTYGRRLTDAGFTAVRVRPFDFVHPLTPQLLIGVLSRLGRLVEHLPVLGEVAGSLFLTARRP